MKTKRSTALRTWKGTLPDLPLKTKFFRGLADASRLSILKALRARSLSIGELVELTGLMQYDASNHLSCMLDSGLVQREQSRRHAFFRLRDARVDVLLDLAHHVLDDAAWGLIACPRYEESELR